MSEADLPLPEVLAEEAEEVRAFLVMLRGGAPFLSGADGRLLVEWLEAGVPTTTILLALEAASARRARRATRSRLSLTACRGELKRLLERRGVKLAEADAPAPVAASERWPALHQLAQDIAAMETPPALSGAREALVKALRSLGDGLDPSGAALPSDPTGETVARGAIAACRAFHDAAWTEAEGEREALLAAARRDLASLAEVLPEDAFHAAAEEVARDRLRARTPLVSATVVWDRLIAGG